jgi:hypothetical protein
MTMTPAIKRQLTMALKADNVSCPAGKIPVITTILAKRMPREQAKHAARKYLAAR